MFPVSTRSSRYTDRCWSNPPTVHRICVCAPFRGLVCSVLPMDWFSINVSSCIAVEKQGVCLDFISNGAAGSFRLRIVRVLSLFYPWIYIYRSVKLSFNYSLGLGRCSREEEIQEDKAIVSLSQIEALEVMAHRYSADSWRAWPLDWICRNL